LGILGTLISSVLDHARTGFENPWLWLPTIVGIFAVVAAVVVGDLAEDTPIEIQVYVAAMALMILTGLIGTILHLQTDFTSDYAFVQERFLKGAPIMAPLNFANMGLIALLLLLDPKERVED
jgi:flagellar motor component MotA